MEKTLILKESKWTLSGNERKVLAELVEERTAKIIPARGNLKCSCKLTWQARTATHRRSRKGEWIERKTPIGTYFCPQPHKELRPSTCPKTISAKEAEAQVWEKVSQFITHPDYLLAQAKEKLAQLQRDYQQMQQEELHLQEDLKKLNCAPPSSFAFFFDFSVEGSVIRYAIAPTKSPFFQDLDCRDCSRINTA